MRNPFRRKHAADPKATLRHMVGVGIRASLEGTEEAHERAAEHIVLDLNGLDRETLVKTLALACLLEGDAVASRIREGAEGLIAHLRDTFSEDTGSGEPEEAASGDVAEPEGLGDLDTAEPRGAAQ